MKEIENWEAIIEDETGNESIAILLPGCIIKGELEGKTVKIKTIDVDISNLIIIGPDEEKYLLASVKKEYLNSINRCIQIGKEERDGEER